MGRKKQINGFFFIGNNKCLDFINTELIGQDARVDLIEEFSDFVDWLSEAELLHELLDESEAENVIERWEGEPEADIILKQARSFRKVLREELVEQLIEGKPVKQSALDEINRYLGECTGRFQLVKEGNKFKTQFHVDYSNPTELIGPIAESAADLLCNYDRALIKQCDNPDCILYFYDTSRNHSRRWCSMELCGNRMKARVHYRRHNK